MGPRRDDTTQARPRIVYLYLAIIVATWAGNWPLMKLALADAPPLSFVLARMVGTLALIAPALLAWRIPLWPARGERLGLFWVGQLQVAGFLICGIIGLSIVPAGRAIVLGYTMPLWAIPIELWLEPQKLGRGRIIGAAIGFAGLFLFMNPRLVDWGDLRVLGGNAMLLLASICWALGSVLYRRRRWRSPFWTQTFWQLAVSTVVIAAIALPNVADQPIRWSPGLVAILAYNWVVSTALGYFLWAKVLAVMPAGIAGQVLALTPVGGFLLSTAIFGGAVTGDIVLSIALIVAGIVVTLRG
ncbi:MAG TPA: EamA family transporter [Stellaceae bacterium]|jgi:drug/metabolite transporter (DMT)-like permease|nr:EamA family transporter [Stellaceae bacterium]